MSNIERMNVALPAEMATLVRDAVEAGEYASNSEVFRDALRYWKLKRQLENENLQDIKNAIQQGLADLKAGNIKPAEEVFARLEAKYKDML